MGKNQNEIVDEDILDPADMLVSLELDDGTTVECEIITIFEVNDQDYIALNPQNTEEVYFYRYYEDEEGNPSIENLESDEEFEIVSDRFDELLDEEEFENM